MSSSLRLVNSADAVFLGLDLSYGGSLEFPISRWMPVEKAMDVIARSRLRTVEHRIEHTIAIDHITSHGHRGNERCRRCGDGFNHLSRLLASEGLDYA